MVRIALLLLFTARGSALVPAALRRRIERSSVPPLRAEAPPRPGFKGNSYLDRLSFPYADEEGYVLTAPRRYSVKDWSENLLNLPTSTVLGRVRDHLVANTLFSIFVVGCYGFIKLNGLPFREWLAPLEPAKALDLMMPFNLSGGILGILLAFRTGQSYDRFWEGRHVWAKVINKVRAIARTARAYAAGDDAEIVRWCVAFPVALKQHLRGERISEEFGMLEPNERAELESADNLPLAVTYALSNCIARIQQAGEDAQKAHHLLWWQLEFQIDALQDAIGEAEAISGTPVPLSYSRHTSRLLSVWTLASPFILVTALPLPLVPPAVALLSWMLLATEEIGHIIEEPFGIHDDRPKILPLQRYCDIVARDLDEANDITARAAAFARRGSASGAPPPPEMADLY